MEHRLPPWGLPLWGVPPWGPTRAVGLQLACRWVSFGDVAAPWAHSRGHAKGCETRDRSSLALYKLPL